MCLDVEREDVLVYLKMEKQFVLYFSFSLHFCTFSQMIKAVAKYKLHCGCPESKQVT